MLLEDEIDRRAEWEADAHEDPDPRDKPFFARWTISGKLSQDEWGELECKLSEYGIRIEDMVGV